MSPLKFGFLSLTIILFFKTANGAIGTSCTDGGNECGTGEVCDVGVSDQCVCDTGNSFVDDGGTCKKDCGNPPTHTGYTVTAGQGTLEGATATVACATGYTGSPASVTCQASGTWTTPSGCSLSNAGSIGPGMIRQQFGLIVLIGVLFRAFM